MNNYMKFDLTSQLTEIDTNCIFLTSRVLSQLTSSLLPFSLMVSWTSQSISSALHWLSSFIKKSILHCLKYRDFNSKISISHDQIGDQKRHFLNFSNMEKTRKIIYLQLIIQMSLKKDVHNFRIHEILVLEMSSVLNCVVLFSMHPVTLIKRPL